MEYGAGVEVFFDAVGIILRLICRDFGAFQGLFMNISELTFNLVR